LAPERDNADELKVARATQRSIGRELRRMYDAITNEPIPDDMLQVLRRIDEERSVS